MLIIMSSAYVDQALKSEFGLLPPSMLPLGNRRLFQHQVKSFPEEIPIYLTLPEDYTLDVSDEIWLQEHNVTVVRIPSGVSLGAALVTALNLIGRYDVQELHVLFGDTLVDPLSLGNDIVAVAQSQDNYDWAQVNENHAPLFTAPKTDSVVSQKVVCGYFKFSKANEIVRSIIKNEWDFLRGLNDYHERVGLNPKTIYNWLDFGHINTYYQSKASFTTQRAFNSLSITSKWVEKTSTNQRKIEAESNWFRNVPYSLQVFLPQFLGELKNDQDQISYRLEYLHYSALNELYVFAELPDYIWKTVMNSCLDFIDVERSEKVKYREVLAEDLFGLKTVERVEEYLSTQKNAGFDDVWVFNGEMSASISEMIEYSNIHLPSFDDINSVMHGDFCFSNILYDFRTSRIKTIDPRGITPKGKLTVYGDFRYDIAKLSHSVLGMYDWIIAGYFDVMVSGRSISLNINGFSKCSSIQKIFLELVHERYGLSEKNLYAMQIHLFLSMLPLHSDDVNRQDALFSNAFRLYKIMKG